MNTRTTGGVSSLHAFHTTTLTALLLCAGCASLDASQELDLAAQTASRVGGSMTPAEAWTLPIEGESPAWNGIDPLTYDDAVAVALQGDPELRRALAVIVERRAQYVQQGLPPNPTVAFGIGTAVDGLSGAPLFVQGMQMLSWIWKNPYRVTAAEAELRASIYTAAERCVDVVARTRTQLASVIAAQRMLALEQQYVEITQQTVELVRSMQEAGELALLDLDRAVVDHEDAVSAMVASEHALQNARLELLGTMGRPTANTDWIAEGDLPPNWDIPTEEDELLALAATGRLDVAAQSEQVHRIEAELGLAETRRFPEVGFTLRYQKNTSGRESVIPGASITLPILDNGDPAVAMQMAKLKQAELELLAAIETAQRQVRIGLNQYLDARIRTDIIRNRQLDAAIAAQTRSDAAYGEGEVDLNTLLMTQRQRIAVERSLVEQEFRTMQAMCELRRAVGGSFDPMLDAVPEIDIKARATTTEQESSS
jgi:outer membrane protein TolC